MKKIISLFFLFFLYTQSFSQELLATVQVNSQQIGGSNQQAFKALEKSLRDFINNTSWTGKKLQNFEKIKCGFAIVISERDVNKFKGSIVVQAVRPVYNTNYETPLLNLQDQRFAFTLFWVMMQTVFSQWEEHNGLQKPSRSLRIHRTETMKAGIPSTNREAVPS